MRIRDLDRFCDKVEIDGSAGCWTWTGCKSTGYGAFYLGKRKKAHRVSYEAFIGPIPAGLQIDHLCRNRSCVNPLHLEPVTQRVNLLRGEGACARHARKTHCLRGHPFTKENTRIATCGGRVCRTCARTRQRIDYKRAAA